MYFLVNFCKVLILIKFDNNIDFFNFENDIFFLFGKENVILEELISYFNI